MNIRKLVSKTFCYYKSNGFKGTVKIICHSLAPFEYREIVMRHKKIEPSDFYLEKDNLNIHVATRQDIDEQYKDFWYTREKALERLNKGCILFLAKDKVVNIFYGWFDSLNIDSLAYWLGIKNLKIPPDVVYLSAVYVPSEHSGRLLLKRGLRSMEKYLLNNTTANKIFSITIPKNIIASRISTLCGYVPYQLVKYLRIIGVKLYIVESLDGKELKRRKVFIQNSNFWNFFSSVLKKDT